MILFKKFIIVMLITILTVTSVGSSAFAMCKNMSPTQQTMAMDDMPCHGNQDSEKNSGNCCIDCGIIQVSLNSEAEGYILIESSTDWDSRYNFSITSFSDSFIQPPKLIS